MCRHQTAPCFGSIAKPFRPRCKPVTQHTIHQRNDPGRASVILDDEGFFRDSDVLVEVLEIHRRIGVRHNRKLPCHRDVINRGDERFGFYCIVTAARDGAQIPEKEEIERLLASPVGPFIRPDAVPPPLRRGA